MGRMGVSIKQMVQKPTENDTVAELVLITDSVKEASFMEALEEIKGLDVVYEVASMIRVHE